MSYLYLAAAVVLEVGGTLSLRMAVARSRLWYLVVGVAYASAFACLSLALHEGMGIGTAYGLWVAGGVALTALLGRVLFGDYLNRTMVAGIGVIVIGVLLVEAGAGHR